MITFISVTSVAIGLSIFMRALRTAPVRALVPGMPQRGRRRPETNRRFLMF